MPKSPFALRRCHSFSFTRTVRSCPKDIRLGTGCYETCAFVKLCDAEGQCGRRALKRLLCALAACPVTAPDESRAAPFCIFFFIARGSQRPGEELDAGLYESEESLTFGTSKTLDHN